MADTVFTVVNELPEMVETLKAVYPDEWRKILADAINQTGYYVLNKYQKELKSYFDRPTDFTIKSMFLRRANPSNREASIEWKEIGSTGIGAGKYLKPQVEGTGRRNKRFEASLQYSGAMPQGYFAVPTDEVAVDSFGNVPAGVYTKILSFLKASFDTTQNRTNTKVYKGRSNAYISKFRDKNAADQQKAVDADRKRKMKAIKYFTIQPGTPGLAPGIYERIVAFGGMGQRRLFTYVKSVTYKASFPFEQIGRDATNAKFEEKLEEAIDKAVASRPATSL